MDLLEPLGRVKKTAHATEQDRPDVRQARQEWFEGQLVLDPDRLIFIDETGTSTKMARTHGRAPRGERLRMGVPHGHWKTTTLVASLSLRGIVAPFVLDGATWSRPSKGRACDACHAEVLGSQEIN